MMLGARGEPELGLDVDVRELPGASDFARLFSETGAYLVELAGDDAGDDAAEGAADGSLPAALEGVPYRVLGVVTAEPELRVRGESGTIVLAGRDMARAWGESFRRVME
jgi:hypothetical protein